MDGLLKCVDCWVGWLDEHCAGADRMSLKEYAASFGGSKNLTNIQAIVIREI